MKISVWIVVVPNSVSVSVYSVSNGVERTVGVGRNVFHLFCIGFRSFDNIKLGVDIDELQIIILG